MKYKKSSVELFLYWADISFFALFPKIGYDREELHFSNFSFMRNFGLFLFSYATRISTLKHMAEGSSGSKSPSQVPNLSPTEATVVVNKT